MLRHVTVIMSCLCLTGVLAQEEQAEKPVLSDLETAYVQIVALSGQLAKCESDHLPSVTQFSALRQDVVQRIEAKHPGYTVNWATGALVLKK